MATTAIYTFIDNVSTFIDHTLRRHNRRYHVYKHYDNNPSAAAMFISSALKESWKLPKFEADEFAAAFIAVNKKGSGDIRIIKSFKHYDTHRPDGHSPSDRLSFRYEIRCRDEKIHVKAFSPMEALVSGDDGCFFEGFLDDFKEYTRKTWNDWIKTL